MILLDFSRPQSEILAQLNPNEAWQESIFSFVKDWLNENVNTFQIQTSGSTSTPKKLAHSRFQMQESASRTNAFFNIHQNAVLFLALPARAIGGRMMLVRAQLASCKIYCTEPSSLPLSTIIADKTTVDFAAFTPMQCYEILKNETQARAFSQIKNVIIGGGKIPNELLAQLREQPNTIYETFGMTETVSHIALRKIAPQMETEFTCLPGISISVNEDSLLQIHLPNEDLLKTNDIVKLNGNNRFTWISRADDVINTGGIKVFANEIEAKLKPYIASPFFITHLPDEKFGQKVILVVENNETSDETFFKLFSEVLLPFEKPKTILRASRFLYSEMGKLMRQASLNEVVKKNEQDSY